MEWDQGATPPLRFCVEFILAALKWMGMNTFLIVPPTIVTSNVEKEPKAFASDWEFNW